MLYHQTKFSVGFHSLFACLLLALAAPLHAATPKQIDASLEKAKAYLYSLQKDGIWDAPAPDKAANAQNADGGQWTGKTALAVYALMAAGEKGTSPKLEKAVDFLVKNETKGVYALGIRMQVWLHLPRRPEFMKAAQRDVKILLESIKTEDTSLGFYDYAPGTGKDYSHSRSQYAVLGVWAAEQMGIEIPGRYWEIVEKAWIDHQAPDGGWTYKLPKETTHATTPGMTAVGVATLFITQDYTRTMEGLACRGNLPNPAIDRGIKWMGDNMDKVATNTKYSRDFPFITLYAVERIGVAAGIKYFNGVDWFDKGSNWLLTKQGASGAFTGGGLGGNLVDTSFAMLFLARGRAPVVFNKFDYSMGQTGPAAPAWNQRPRDVANVTRWMGAQVEQYLNWQVLPATAPLADFFDAPILYVSGTKPLALDEATKAKLKAYVAGGGMILGNADCGGAGFSTTFRALGSELFPDYEFRELPENHPIYTGNFPRSKWRTKPSIYGLSNGVRELMVLVPTGDPARHWQSRIVGGKEEFWQMGGAFFLYTSEGKDLRFRGDTHLVAARANVKPSRSLTVTQLQYAGNWNPEPGAWPRLAAVAHNDARIEVKLAQAKLGTGQLSASGPSVAHLTGTAKFTLTAEQRAELKKFVDAGGLLLVDAAGGSAAFADAAEAELKQVFAGQTLDLLPEGHALYAPDGERIEIRYRRSAQKALAGQSRAPRLRALLVNGKPGVIYSREDLTGGMVGQSVEGIIGYDTETVAQLVPAILTQVVGPEPRPATKPTTKPAGAATKPTAGAATKTPAK